MSNRILIDNIIKASDKVNRLSRQPQSNYIIINKSYDIQNLKRKQKIFNILKNVQ